MHCLPIDFPGAVSTVPVLKNFMSLETEDVVAARSSTTASPTPS